MGGHDHGTWRVGRARVRASILLATLALTAADAVVLGPAVHAASPPVTGDDVARTDSGVGLTIVVIDNDYDPDGDSFAVVAVATPPHGTVEAFSNAFNYTPDAGFSGIETITYTVQ